MKIIERIYTGIFILAVVAVSVLLNSPIVRSGSTMSEVVEQQNLEKYNAIEVNNENELAIEDELEEE